VLVLPVIQDWRSYPFTPIHEKVTAECAAMKIPVADLLDAFRSSPLPWRDLRVGPNDEHPNAVQSWSPVPKTHCLTSDFSPAAVFRNPVDELWGRKRGDGQQVTLRG